VPTRLNLADSASRGISAKKLMRSRTRLTGPDFLCNDEGCWPASPVPSIDVNPFLHVERSEAVSVIVSEGATDRLIKRYSSLYALTKATAWMLRFKAFLLCKANLRPGFRLQLFVDCCRASPSRNSSGSVCSTECFSKFGCSTI